MAIECGEKALKLDSSCADAYSLLSLCHLSNTEYDQAIAMSEQAITLSPSNAVILGGAAVVQNKSGQPQRALELIKKAMRCCPVYSSWYLVVLGTSYRLTGQTDAAIVAFEEAARRSEDLLSAHVNLASTLGEVDRQEDARKSVSEILRLDPDFSIKKHMASISYRDPDELERFEDGLRKVGLPA
jgi:tetratricopeptide (TPR) repeat protein